MADSTETLRHIAGNPLDDGSQRCMRCCEPLASDDSFAPGSYVNGGGRIPLNGFADCTAYDPHPDHEDAEVEAGDRELVATA